MPPTRGIRIVEIAPGTPVDATGRLRVRRAELRQPGDYERRFEELMGRGLPSINVSCYGVDDGKLIMAIEAPRPPAKASPRTSVNYAGPSATVLGAAWSVDKILAIE